MKSIYKIFWTPLAQEEYFQIIDSLEIHWSLEIVQRLVVEVDKTIEFLKQNPFLFQIVNERPDVRGAVILKLNTLYYRIKENNSVEIISFFQNRTDPNEQTF